VATAGYERHFELGRWAGNLPGQSYDDLTQQGTVTVGKSLTMPYAIRASAGKSLTTPFAISNGAGRSLTMPYLVRAAVGRSLSLPYALRAAAGRSLTTPYMIHAAAGRSLTLPYLVRALAGRSLTMPYVVRPPAAGLDLTMPYRILALGPQPNPDHAPFPELIVEVAPASGSLTASPVWEDVSADVVSIEIKRGRQSELDQYEAGTMVVVLRDRVGGYDPTNPGSIGLAPMTQIRVRAKYGAGSRRSVYRGVIERITPRRHSRKELAVELECVDPLAQLAAALVPVAPSVGELYYAAQDCDARIRAAIADGGFPSSRTFVATGNVVVQGTSYSAGESVLAVIGDAVDAEFPGVGQFYADAAGIITFWGRRRRLDDPDNPYFPPIKARLGDAGALELDPTRIPIRQVDEFPLELDVDDVINDALVYPRGTNPSSLPAQRRQDTASQGRYGRRAREIETLTLFGLRTGNNAAGECVLFANYLINNYRDPQPRIPLGEGGALQLSGGTASARPTTDQWDFMLGVELGDRVTLTLVNPGGGGLDEQVFFVEGIEHQLEPPYTWLTSLELSPATYWGLGL
jgi:hypothetical protein